MDKKELQIIPINELQVMAQAACKSGLFQMPSPEAALTLMLLCQAEGLHPIQALRQYHIIKGRPAMRADAMQAAFQAAGGNISWVERNDKKCSAEFSHSQGGKILVEWTIDMAAKAGLTNNPTWQKFPRAMLSARCVSEGVRAVYPAVVCGLYCPEEVQDFDLPAEKAPAKSAKKAEKSAEVPAKVEKPAKIEAETIEVVPVVHAPTVEPSLVERCIGEAKPEPEFVPGTVEVEHVEIVAADRPTHEANNMPAAQVAAEIKQVRTMAQRYGCKSQKDFTELMFTITGEEFSSASQLTNNAQRASVITWLTTALLEEQKEAA